MDYIQGVEVKGGWQKASRPRVARYGVLLVANDND